MTTSAPTLPAGLDASLENLRDVRLPDTVSWWPPAPGWWLLALCVTVAFGVALLVVARRRRSVGRAALGELERLRAAAAAGTAPGDLAAALGALVRRTVLATEDGKRLAGVHGPAWERHLAAGEGGLPVPLARWLSVAPYAGPGARSRSTGDVPSTASADIEAPDPDTLFDAVERWIRRNAR